MSIRALSYRSAIGAGFVLAATALAVVACDDEPTRAQPDASTSTSDAHATPNDGASPSDAAPPGPSLDASSDAASEPDATDASDAGDASPGFVGAAGGKVTSDDGAARLEVPAGALSKPEPIAIALVASPKGSDALASNAYEFTPNKLSFAADATICIRPNAGAELKGACLGYFDEVSSSWKCEDPCLVKSDKLLCGSTSHFTSFAILLSGGSGTDTTCTDKELGPAGGTLTSKDGHATLTVPKDALKERQRLSVHMPGTKSDEIISPAYDFGPNGTKFGAAATLCLEPNPGAKTEKSCLGYQDNGGKWKCEDPCPTARDGGVLCGETSHFTNFAVLLEGGSGATCPKN